MGSISAVYYRSCNKDKNQAHVPVNVICRPEVNWNDFVNFRNTAHRHYTVLKSYRSNEGNELSNSFRKNDN